MKCGPRWVGEGMKVDGRGVKGDRRVSTVDSYPRRQSQLVYNSDVN
jgi:hypothetical protein